MLKNLLNALQNLEQLKQAIRQSLSCCLNLSAFHASSTSDVKVILSYILEQEQTVIRRYGDFMTKIRDKDDLTYHLLREILEDEIRRESEIEAIINLSRDRGLNSIQYRSSLVVKKMD